MLRQADGTSSCDRVTIASARAARDCRSMVGCERIGMSAGGVPLSDVLARWAYSEVSDGHAFSGDGWAAATAALGW